MLLCCCEVVANDTLVSVTSMGWNQIVTNNAAEHSVEPVMPKNVVAKPQCKLYQGGTPTLGETFLVTIQKTPFSRDMGISLIKVDGVGLLVHTVQEGLISDWNLSQPNLMVLQHDCIYKVNGQTGFPSDLFGLLKSENELELTIRRCETFCVQFNQRDECRGLGLGFEYNASRMTLPINSLRDGLMADWNQEDPSQAVRVGDIIVTVNGVCGSASKMLGKIRTESSFCLIVLRPPVNTDCH